MKIQVPNLPLTVSGVPEEATNLVLSEVNWPKEFPYKPEVKVRIWHNGKNLFLHFDVDEKYIAANASSDNGEVWKDSCVEFFIAFDKKGYYNIEANCIGKILMSHRKSRKEDINYAEESILSNIKRTTTLGNQPFSVRNAEGKWSLTLEIPATSFFKHSLTDFTGLTAKCNVYKCGDNLPEPHFLSFNPIETDSPDFHRPEFFDDIIFQ